MSTLNTAPVPLTLGGITIEELSLIAIEGARLAVAAEVDERIQASRAVVEHALARDQLVYGLTSQVGHGRDQRVDPEALSRYQELLVRSHAGGVGAPLPEEQVRAVMLARIAGLARGDRASILTRSTPSSRCSTRGFIQLFQRADRSGRLTSRTSPRWPSS